MNDLEKGDSLSGEQEELVNSGFDISDEVNVIRKDKYCSRNCSCLRLPRWVRCLLITLFIITYYVLETEYMVYAYDYEDENTTSTNDNVAARLRGGHSFHRKTCEEDTEYGCCEIYYNCHIVGDSHIDYDTNNINLYKVSADDVLKSNCPSLRTLINKYNDHYGSDDCGEFGCCNDFNGLRCDDTLHTNLFKIGNNENLIDLFNTNTNGNTMKINVPKIDHLGSNCWNKGWGRGIKHFITKFEDNYPKDEPCNWVCVLEYIGFVIVIVACLAPHR